jgi:hypothetical protein
MRAIMTTLSMASAGELFAFWSSRHCDTIHAISDKHVPQDAAMNSMVRYLQSIGDVMLWLFAHALAIFGLVLIVERFVHDALSVDLGISGVGIKKISNYLAILAFLFVCLSVYLEDIARTPPSWATLHFSAPAMLILGVILLAAQTRQGSLDVQYIDGCTLLALGGALLRVRGVPMEALFPNGARRK